MPSHHLKKYIFPYISRKKEVSSRTFSNKFIMQTPNKKRQQSGVWVCILLMNLSELLSLENWIVRKCLADGL